jgi:hemolysin III
VRLPHLDVHGLEKPLLRGRIHAVAFFVAVPAGVVLVLSARAGVARVAAVVYALSLVALFGASSAYHRFGRTERSQRVLRRLDHSTIYILIAGSYTPVCLVVLDGWWRWTLLAGVWTAAIVGVVLKLVHFDRSSMVGGALYIVMGWAAVAAGPSLLGAVSTPTLVLLVAGGVVYTAGAIVLATRFPNPSPRVFGYHEVWHTMVVAACCCHYAMLWHLL